ncbi:signal peptidase complex catalytic subunit SEC11 [Ascoidea rubescens DSM 1968]|uniref:Signal peptidase complex catalytic subunit SEC11 n=1 Tax=Ascoidea rubescens DSM 1968 TaxID=1344418 RepID=A0A1D2VQ36_9ASCO|nr:endoplasmic reticulum-type signal peptidase [Ascoidea rubescens DSM 1968]ODV63730.1 endoplasmic reticulum-type signal peptidase [Ascoidea rubescens DSM 1968]
MLSVNRQQISQLLQFALIVSSAFMIWKTLSVITNSESPIVVVLSGSMEPAFQRGDILFLNNRQTFVDAGDIVVYQIKHREIPIVHRVMNQHSNLQKLKQFLLTKGDNNPVNDLSLYNRNQLYLNREKDILGVVKGYLPKVGYLTIFITENAYFKYTLLGLMAISSILQRDE